MEGLGNNKADLQKGKEEAVLEKAAIAKRLGAVGKELFPAIGM